MVRAGRSSTGKEEIIVHLVQVEFENLNSHVKISSGPHQSTTGKWGLG